MKHVYSIKSDNPAEQRIVAGFFNAFNATELSIAYKPQFMQRGVPGEAPSFMPIVNHPEKRVVLKDGEFAKTLASHPDPKKAYLNNMILMRGTPYGVIVLHGRAMEYEKQKNGFVLGPVPQLHATQRFVAAAMRFFKRKGLPVRLGDSYLKEWIFSDTFAADLAEQADLDRQAEITTLARGMLLGDGLPKRIRQQHPVNKARPQGATTHAVSKAPNQNRQPKAAGNQVIQPGLHAGGYPV